MNDLLESEWIAGGDGDEPDPQPDSDPIPTEIIIKGEPPGEKK